MNVNLDKVRDDLAKVNEEIAETEHMMTSLTAQLALLQGRRTDLETFLRMVEDYRTTKVTPTAALHPPAQPSAPARARLVVRPVEAQPAVDKKTTAAFFQQRSVMTLKRQPEARQTKIALRLVEVFEPNSTLTAVEAQEKLGTLLDNSSRLTRVHYVSSYLAREADATNGILERVEMGKYRLRQDAKTRLAEHIETTTPQQPVEEQQESSSA